ncbi:S41 family peptidase [soil metagenome]
MKHLNQRIALGLLLCAALAIPQILMLCPVPVQVSPSKAVVAQKFDGAVLYNAAFDAIVKYDLALAHPSTRAVWMSQHRLNSTVSLGTEQATDSAILAMIKSLGERYNFYLSPESTKREAAEIKPEMVGIGVVLRINGADRVAQAVLRSKPQDPQSAKQEASQVYSKIKVSQANPVEITEVVPGSPAEQAGIIAGDQIQSIDGRNITGLTLSQVGDLIHGAQGTSVQMYVKTGQQTRTVSIRWALFISPVVHFKMLINAIAYMKLDDFMSENALPEMVKALAKAQSSKAIILDLRGNPGGRLETVNRMIELFLSSGTVIETQEREGDQLISKRTDVTPDWRIVTTTVGSKVTLEAGERIPQIVSSRTPLVILVDEDSFSASEILAGSLQANNRATVIGLPTGSKGVAQLPIDLPFGRSIHVTVSVFLPGGKAIDWIGVVPDLKVQQPAEFIVGEDQSDAQLQAAIKVALKLAREREQKQMVQQSLCAKHHLEFDPNANRDVVGAQCSSH